MGRPRKRAAKSKTLDLSKTIEIVDDSDEDCDQQRNTKKRRSSALKACLDTLKVKKRLEVETKAMATSSDGKATMFVGKLISFVNELKGNLPKSLASKINIIAEDDLWLLAKKFFDQQAEFAQNGIPTNISVGFHYTDAPNIETISWRGLLSKPEREARSVDTHKYPGSSYGEGIYTASDPSSSSQYGDTGLIVARLAGKSAAYDDSKCHTDQYEKGNHSIQCNGNWLVLEKTSQCLVLAQFSKEMGVALSSKNSRGTKSRKKKEAILCDLPGKLLKLFES